MKILRVISSMHPKNGGPCQGIRNSIPAMEKLGVVNEVVCLDAPTEQFIANDPFVVHALGKAKGGWAYNSNFQAWLRDHLREYDVVIMHGLWLYPSYAASNAIKKFRKDNPRTELKFYVMPHGMLDPWFQRDKSRRLKALRNEIYWKWLEKNVVNSADGLLFTCEQELLLARGTFKGYSPKLELNIGYGIQAPPNLLGQVLPSKVNKPYWLFLSRIHPKKGVDQLLNAYFQLKKEHVNVPDLVIAGPLESAYAESMRVKAAACGDIHFVGMLQGDAKWKAFYGCEAFVLPSHQENFGISVVEAMACNKPVLITNQVNIWREIEEGQGGLIDTDTNEGTYQILKKFALMDETQKKEMGHNAGRVYQKNFTIEEAAKKMLDAFIR
ncbi:glycosyltransferase [Sphingobacterium pedocola]|uniref:Glycosyl transferase family 1 n=1 Tax=Sphingobacterium pedocola TaxID=2082722 RepID=A0ABR9T1X0_9SPHI|nr:glycosyltransferase [Sphingobacterium pedocola]MBE8719330.1 glycosyl transferase family 1 [Sphingobacterium pedocola]